MRLAFCLLMLCLLPFAVHSQATNCSEAGALSRETYTGAGSDHERRFHIYLPPCYASTNADYPLLMLLHGSNADDLQWALLGFLQALETAIHEGRAAPMIVVMPFGGQAANDNVFGDNSYDQILLNLLDIVSERYRLNGARAIGGISRGGFWAYHLGLRFPDQFVAIGGHSPFFDADHAPAAYNPLHLAATLSADTDLRLWLDRGSNDYAAAGIEQMRVNLQAARAPHDYVVYPGGDHSDASWSRNIDDYLAFYSRAFSPADPSAASDDGGARDELELWLPAAGFGTLLVSIDSADLQALLAGHFDGRLILSQSAAARLRQQGFTFHSGARIVAHDQLFGALWRDKRSFTLLPANQLQLPLRVLWLDDMPVVDQLDRYPLAFDSDFPNFSRDKLTRITLSGTTALARHTLPAIDAIGVERAVSGIRDYALRSDYFHITNEASLAPGCPTLDTIGYAGSNNSMCMKPAHAAIFDLLDVDVVDLTGNHINDFGYEPLLHTLEYFEQRDMALVGGGRDPQAAREALILEHKGSRIGWIACNDIGPAYAYASDDPNSRFGQRPGAAPCDRNWLRETLAVLASQVDLVLMTVQYREFERFTPTDGQKFDYRTFAEWGADIVVGTAEHKPMTFEFYPTNRGETAFIHYGLGNLFFDQLLWGNRRFFLDTLYIYDGRLLSVEVFPGIIDERARPRLLTGEDRFNFLHFMFIQKNEF